LATFAWPTKAIEGGFYRWTQCFCATESGVSVPVKCQSATVPLPYGVSGSRWRGRIRRHVVQRRRWTMDGSSENPVGGATRGFGGYTEWHSLLRL